ncbi:MAG: phosphoadenylyl-sulfate reductase [Actinomycetota bacterium]|nr:phosphoadenylyl-sulfate reductase [Actinomycetota bacterium]
MDRSPTLPGSKELEWEAKRLEDAQPEEILEWGLAVYGEGLTLSVSFGGAEGMVLLDMLARITRDTDAPKIRVYTLDTGFLFEETVRFREEAMRRYDLQLEVMRPRLTVAEQVALYGEQLYSCKPNICCQIRKVEPQERALKGYDAWVTGIRRDQTPQRANTPIVAYEEYFEVAKIAPLARWSADDVEEYVRRYNVPLNPLLSMGYRSIGCEPCTRPVAPGEDARAGRWPGSEKTECGLHYVGGA